MHVRVRVCRCLCVCMCKFERLFSVHVQQLVCVFSSCRPLYILYVQARGYAEVEGMLGYDECVGAM